MPNKNEHTLRRRNADTSDELASPWKRRIGVKSRSTWIENEKGDIVCEVGVDFEVFEIAVRTCGTIVRAVNSLESNERKIAALVEALTMAYPIIRDLAVRERCDPDEQSGLDPVAEAMRAALKLAKGGE